MGALPDPESPDEATNVMPGAVNTLSSDVSPLNSDAPQLIEITETPDNLVA